VGTPSVVPSAVRPPSTTNSDDEREEQLERSFDRIIEEGRPRLQRGWADLLSTGIVAGTEVAFGVLALLYVDSATGSTLLGGLAFSIGFISLRLGHSELFTEGFLVPVTVVAAGEAPFRNLLRLWVGTLIGNLLGGFLMAWIIDQAFPSLHKEAITTAGYYLHTPIGGRSLCLAILAGGAITLLTRMHNGTDDEMAKLLASVAIGFLLAGTRLFHSVLDSPFGYVHWLGWLGWVVLGNMLGGIGLTTLLRLVRSRHRLIDHRVAAEHNDRSDHD
jgi:formate/nitrite transporter FocA (FNT family)